jgi:hypothetical protein
MKLLPIFLMLFAWPAFAQVDATTASAYSVVGLTNTTNVSGLLLSSTAPTQIEPVGLLDVVTDAANVSITATDANRLSVPVTKLSDRQWLWKSPGRVEFLIEVVDFDKRIWAKKLVSAQIDGKPLPPTPPQPKPDDPKPPKPPAPDEKLEGLSVLIVYESGKLPSYTPTQLSTINSTDLRTWMNTSVQWRVLDKDTKFPADSKLVYAKWINQPFKSLPWLVIGNDSKVAFSGPMPASAEEIKSTITRFKK